MRTLLDGFANLPGQVKFFLFTGSYGSPYMGPFQGLIHVWKKYPWNGCSDSHSP